MVIYILTQVQHANYPFILALKADFDIDQNYFNFYFLEFDWKIGTTKLYASGFY